MKSTLKIVNDKMKFTVLAMLIVLALSVAAKFPNDTRQGAIISVLIIKFIVFAMQNIS